jgi:trimeric autotransporter adhesin
MTRNIVWRSAVPLAFLTTLSACGGGGGGDDPPASFTVSANVSGLTGTGLVLRNNGGNDLAVTVNGTATFTNSVASGANYDVTVATQPAAQTCAVTNGSGTVANANVSNVAVACTSNGPDAPVVTLSSNTKRHSLQWPPAARASFYRVYKTQNTDTDFQLISGDILAQTFNHDPVAVHLEDWAHLRYRVDACNASTCTSSAPSVAANSLPLVGYFKAGNSNGVDVFGRRAVISGDGNTVAIAAVGEDSAPGNPIDNSDDGSGAVYVYVRVAGHDTWFQQVMLKASDSSVSWAFGGDLSISDDGNTLAVGATRHGTIQGIPGNSPGAVYVFTRNTSTRIWTEQARLQAANATARDRFGTTVALSGDGNTVLVNAPHIADTLPDYGSAYVFTRDAGVWTQQPNITATNSGQTVVLGDLVAISTNGGTLAIGSGLDVYLFQRSGNSWVQETSVRSPAPNPQIVTTLALSGDGNTLSAASINDASNARGIGGDPTDVSMPMSGGANVFIRNGGTWAHQAYVKASNTDTNDRFGNSVDLSDDGNIMSIGAPWEQSRAAGVGGDQADNGADRSGAVYMFRRTGSTWTQVNYVHSHQPDPDDQFGTSVSLSGDGITMVVGAPNEDGSGKVFNAAEDETATFAGAAYIF